MAMCTTRTTNDARTRTRFNPHSEVLIAQIHSRDPLRRRKSPERTRFGRCFLSFSCAVTPVNLGIDDTYFPSLRTQYFFSAPRNRVPNQSRLRVLRASVVPSLHLDETNPPIPFSDNPPSVDPLF
jgi:hypothetical protein